MTQGVQKSGTSAGEGKMVTKRRVAAGSFLDLTAEQGCRDGRGAVLGMAEDFGKKGKLEGGELQRAIREENG